MIEQWNYRRLSRFWLTSFLSLTVGLFGVAAGGTASVGAQTRNPTSATKVGALSALNKLAVKGRAPKTGYERSAFSDGWGRFNGCDTRNLILARDLKNVTFRDACIVESGTLQDPYTGKSIDFVRGVGTSLAVQIDHVVALSDAWQKGAQKISAAARYSLYNDPLNLLAVDGPTNGAKSDSDAASWLPPNKGYRCSYVARQIAVKRKYLLWVTLAEKSAMAKVLSTCPSQKLPRR
ncbi:MAG: HNH endonuclease family protein [Micrococcales bacterium]